MAPCLRGPDVSCKLHVDGLAGLGDDDEFGEPHHIEGVMEAVVLPELETDGDGETIEPLGEEFVVVAIELALGVDVERFAVVDDVIEPGHALGWIGCLAGNAIRSKDGDSEMAKPDCRNAVIELDFVSAGVHRC